ncbi:MAG: putative sulfate exporter family transporter, partial [Pyrinomonadaceae bacterium]
IIPLALALAFAHRDKGAKSKVTLPWFIFFFVGAAAVRTYGSSMIFPSMFDSFVNFAKAGLAVTLFLIGLSLSMATLRSVGWRPFALGAILWIIIGSAALAAVLRFA